MTAVSLAGKPFYFYYPALTYRVFSNDRNQLKKRYDIDYARLTSGIFMTEFIETNNVHEDLCYRKTLKPLTQILIPEVEFHRPPKANESEDTGWHHSSNRKVVTIQNKWMYCLKLHSCFGRQSIATQNGSFQWLAIMRFLHFRGLCLHPMVKRFTLL